MLTRNVDILLWSRVSRYSLQVGCLQIFRHFLVFFFVSAEGKKTFTEYISEFVIFFLNKPNVRNKKNHWFSPRKTIWYCKYMSNCTIPSGWLWLYILGKFTLYLCFLSNAFSCLQWQENSIFLRFACVFQTKKTTNQRMIYVSIFNI